VLLGVLALGGSAWIIYAFLPRPARAEVAAASRGPMQVTVDEDGKTRIKDRYVVSAPLSGRLRRIDLDPGDAVAAGETVIAVIEPTDPSLLDARALAEAEARVRAADAALRQAEPRLVSANAALEFARREHQRVQRASERNAASVEELEDAALFERTRLQDVRAAEFAVEIAKFELEQAQAALLRTSPEGETGEPEMRFVIQSPIDGRVLRVFQESVAVIAAGTPLVEVGDPSDLEVVIDVLSTDAVQINPGDEVIIEDWGGPQALRGEVRLVEPSAFTKISALGVEEQRVNVVADLVNPPADRPSLGDNFRIEARIVVWREDDVLRIPASALFRSGEGWAVFVAESGRARLRPVEIGRRNGLEAQIEGGLREGEQVITHPSDRIADGVAIEPA
jgi:HlyD family secretion protein